MFLTLNKLVDLIFEHGMTVFGLIFEHGTATFALIFEHETLQDTELKDLAKNTGEP